MQLIDQFERISIINLPERADRRAEINGELARMGRRIDGQHIRLFPAIRPNDAGEFPSLGARGCFMSHRAVIKQALDDGVRNVLVMEDDLLLDPRFIQPQSAMCTTLQQNHWEIAYLGHIDPAHMNSASPTFVTTDQPQVTLHCYALNREVLEPLYQYLSQCLERPNGHPLGSQMHVDGAFSLFRQFNPQIRTLIATPSLGHQRSSRSDIAHNRWFDRTPVLRQAAGLLRRWKNQHA